MVVSISILVFPYVITAVIAYCIRTYSYYTRRQQHTFVIYIILFLQCHSCKIYPSPNLHYCLFVEVSGYFSWFIAGLCYYQLLIMDTNREDSVELQGNLLFEGRNPVQTLYHG